MPGPEWLEAAIRLSVFFGVFAAVAVWEGLAPRRRRRIPRAGRWPANLALVVGNTVLMRALFPTAAVGMAMVADARGWGFLALVGWPVWVESLVAVGLLDLAITLQHVLFHAVPLLWRFHQVHHADLDLDVTSGARFHPVEMVLSMGIKLALVALIGPPVIAVVIFETLLNGMAMFNHGNVRMPRSLDRVLRWFVVTPDMHRIHHSVRVDETNSNFGFNLSLWDRLFGTYRDAPVDGHLGMTVGLDYLQGPDAERQGVGWLLALPFRTAGRAYAMGGPIPGASWPGRSSGGDGVGPSAATARRRG